MSGTTTLTCSILQGFVNTSPQQPVRCQITPFTSPTVGVWVLVTNFNQISATQNLMFQFQHTNAAVNPATGSYTAEFYVWANAEAEAYSYSGLTTTLTGHPAYYTSTQRVAMLMQPQAGSVTTNQLSYNAATHTINIDINVVVAQTNIYNTPGVYSNLRLWFNDNYGTPTYVSALMDQPSYDPVMFPTMNAAWTSTWLTASCQNAGAGNAPAQGTGFNLQYQHYGANNQTWPFQYCNDRTLANKGGQGPKGQQRWTQYVGANNGFIFNVAAGYPLYSNQFFMLQNFSMMTQSEVYIPSYMENNGCSPSGVTNVQVNDWQH
jgi:hypothetical protein